jgi:hypothetical protein
MLTSRNIFCISVHNTTRKTAYGRCFGFRPKIADRPDYTRSCSRPRLGQMRPRLLVQLRAQQKRANSACVDSHLSGYVIPRSRFRFRAIEKTGRIGLRPRRGEWARRCGCLGHQNTHRKLESTHGVRRGSIRVCCWRIVVSLLERMDVERGTHAAGGPLLGSLEEKLRVQMNGIYLCIIKWL